jgi:1,4-dihydroxy-2-naphthoate polyprenyltransferase
MIENVMKTIRQLIRLSRPLFLLGGILLFALGGGIANYLGITINWGVYLLGQAWVTTLQLAAQFLNEYFDAPIDNQNPNRTPFTGGSGVLGPDGLPRRVALMAAYGCLAVTASLTVLLIVTKGLSLIAIVIMILALLGAIFYSVPPIRLSATGYGELTTSILVANLVPALSFLLQTGNFHRLLAMSTFPLTLLHMAMMISFEFPDYSLDANFGKRTLTVRVGWQLAMTINNLLILGAYFMLGLAVAFGLPMGIALPAFLTFPLGLLQIWQLRRIADGVKPNWTTLTLNAMVLFAVTAYLLAYSFWTR